MDGLAVLALPAGATAIFDSLSADAAETIGFAFQLAGVIFLGWVVFRLVKFAILKWA